ncbi:MAG: hypothetical protein A2X08_11325 [Bacteroidetes bacterium GWA2_32_17]|nr:MAG: hypothetical protein A2X08_11325 [Bacteroidetes bacterium GWA2_32_17]
MIKYIFLFIVAVLFLNYNNNIYSQNHRTIDSLIKVLHFQKNDTLKVITLSNLCAEYVGNNPKIAKDYANQSLELSKKIDYKHGIAGAYNEFGLIYHDEGNFPLSLDYYLKSIKAHEENGDKYSANKVLTNIAVLYQDQGNYEKALEYYFKDIELNINKEISHKGTVYNNIGIIYKNTGEYKKALEYHKKGLEYRIKTKDKKTISASYNNIGTTYESLKQFDKSLDYYFKSLKIREELNDINGLAATSINIGMTYYKIKQYQTALKYLEKGLTYAKIAGNRNWQLNAYGNFVDVYDALKDYKNEKDYLFKYIYLNDSLYNIAKSDQMIAMETKFETERKEAENKELAQQNQIQALTISNNRYLMAGLAGLLVLIVIIGFLFIHQNKLKSQQQSIKLEQKLLRSQMNPHFIFNSLASIESFIYEHQPKDAGMYLSDFSRLMRLILDNSASEYITLEKEIETLNYYLSLQKLRLNDNFTYTIEVDEELDPEEVTLPPMLTQPFIENAIEHGFRGSKRTGIINIFFNKIGNNLQVQITDNGIGIMQAQQQKDSHKKHKSMALQITNERLKFLNKSKKKKLSYTIEDLSLQKEEQTGTKIIFSIPV